MALIRCNFCGRSQNDVERLVASDTSCNAICAECVVRCVEVLVIGHEPETPQLALTTDGSTLADQILGRAS